MTRLRRRPASVACRLGRGPGSPCSSDPALSLHPGSLSGLGSRCRPDAVVLSLEETTHREDVLHLSASRTHCTGSFVSPQSHPRRKEARFSHDRFVPSRRTGHPEGPAAAGEVAPGNPQRGGREREAEPPPAYVGPRRGLPGFCFSGPANDLGEKRMPERMALTSQR